MQTAFAKLTALLAAKWTGEITIRITVNQGGIMRARVCTDEVLTLD